MQLNYLLPPPLRLPELLDLDPLLPDDEERDDDPLERLTDPELLEPDELLLTELPELLVEEPEEAL
jgi:hypothetical protein